MSWITTYLETAVSVGDTEEITAVNNTAPDIGVSPVELSEEKQSALTEQHVFTVGGPIANPVSRHILYGVTDPDQPAAAAMEQAEMRWVFDLCPTDAVEDTPVSQLHRETVHPRWPLINRETRERFLPDTFDGTRRDFFLITYTANPYNDTYNALLAAGCSQPGTRAAYSILTNQEDIRGSTTFHEYLVNGSENGDKYFTVAGRCHVENGAPVAVADIDFTLLS